MSFIRNPHIAENLDTFGAGDTLDNTRVTDSQRDAAWSLLRRHGALDIAPALGISTEGVER